jgi:hypothetical protein
MINFVHGEGVARGVRHMELRMWYVREMYQRGDFELLHMASEVLPADKLTKLGNTEEHHQFTRAIMGLELLKDVDHGDFVAYVPVCMRTKANELANTQ